MQQSPPFPPARAAVDLVSLKRWAALATVGPGGPSVSFVAYAPEPGLEGILMFLSGLSQHTSNLLHDSRASLGITEADDGSGNPQELARVTLYGGAGLVRRESEEFDSKWEVYRERFPSATRLLPLLDFALFRFEIDRARYVGGFARAATLRGDQLRAVAGR